jgi:hypothetical protein
LLLRFLRAIARILLGLQALLGQASGYIRRSGKQLVQYKPEMPARLLGCLHAHAPYSELLDGDEVVDSLGFLSMQCTK